MRIMARSAELTEFWKCKSNNSNNFIICNVCRLCANVCDNVVPIFDKINEKGSIYDKLKKCLPSISVRENDFKPKHVCVSCVSKLDLCVSFIEMSLDADYKFDAFLQTRIAPPMPITNDRFTQSIATNSDLSWLQIKTEPHWNDVQSGGLTNGRTEQSHPLMSNVTSAQPNQSKSYEPAQPPVSLAQFKIDNDDFGVLLNKQDSNRSNLLQNLIAPDTISAQDLIVLVELRNKDNNALAGNAISTNGSKRNDATAACVPDGCDKIASSADISALSSKLIDSAIHNFDLSSLADFDDEQCLLKAFENDILLSALKTENAASHNYGLTFGDDSTKEPEKRDKDTAAKGTPDAASSNIRIVTPADSMKKSPPIRDFSCGICGRGFTRRNRLNAHIARHSSERPHSCDKCDQRFITRWDLTLHLRIHSGVFSCEYCGKAFPAKGKLERHRRTHTGERPFPCTLCTKAFSEKRNLENHLKTHAAANARNNNANACRVGGGVGVGGGNGNSNSSTCSSISSASGKSSTTAIPPLSGGMPTVFLSCGHINTLNSYAGQRKSCDICQRLTGAVAGAAGGGGGGNRASGTAVTSVNLSTAAAMLAKTQVTRPAVNSLRNSNSNNNNNCCVSIDKVASSSSGR